MFQKHTLAAAGSTGTTAGIPVAGLACGGAYDAAALLFVVEVAGATPTVTYKFQGSVDGTNWHDLAYITDASDTVAVAALTKTAVGAYVVFLSNPVARKYSHFRLVVSANTNITYRAELYLEA